MLDVLEDKINTEMKIGGREWGGCLLKVGILVSVCGINKYSLIFQHSPGNNATASLYSSEEQELEWFDSLEPLKALVHLQSSGHFMHTITQV